MTTIKLIAALAIALAIVPGRSNAAEPSTGRRVWNGVCAAAMNVLPIASAFASPRCLPGYVACKISFATMGLVASGTQLVVGGDVEGAKRTAGRALGGDWLVLPRHLATGAKPDPYPEAAADDEDPDLPSF